MSTSYGNLCSIILEQYFGELIQKVGDCLFAANSRTLGGIIKATHLSRSEVCSALRVLIQFHLVKFAANENNDILAEYSLNYEEILHILRYPRYVHLVQMKFGDVGAAIADEILSNGSQTASRTIINCTKIAESNYSMENLRNTFISMIQRNYLIKLPQLQRNDEENPIPQFYINPCELFTVPDIDVSILNKIQDGSMSENDAKDAEILWKLNFNRFHQDFRDDIMLQAIERRLGATAAECMQYILKQMYEKTDPWQKEASNPFTLMEIKQSIDKTSKNTELIKYLDQYLSLIANDSLGFINKVGDMGGGEYVVNMNKAFTELAFASIESIITQRFGSKATRIFRVVRFKRYIEQENLQKEAMIPSKEAKLLSYNLFQEQYLHIKIIRRAGGGGGTAKAFFLFHIKLPLIIRSALDSCYKAAFNAISRSNHEKLQHLRLIEKSEKLDNILAGIKERGESDEYISEVVESLTPPERQLLEAVKNRIKLLSKAELVLDETIFLFQMCTYHVIQ